MRINRSLALDSSLFVFVTATANVRQRYYFSFNASSVLGVKAEMINWTAEINFVNIM